MSSRNKNDVKKLFEFWCEVSPTRGVDRSTRAGAAVPAGVIIESFPENFRDQKTLTDIPTFALPSEIESDSLQSFSFVLTTDDSKWRYGFCRFDPKTQTVMVIITYLPWHDTFMRFLPVLAELRRGDMNEFRTFLSEVYNSGTPNLGKSLSFLYSNGQYQYVFECPSQFQLPSLPGNHNLNLYYNFVDPKNMIAVFAAMLAERRIIFTSRRLDRLSSCVQAANAFLYPMVWQHIFIPVLPMKLKDYLSAPMPYLIGVPELVLETMTPDELGEVVILNCDTNIFESPFNDVNTLPTEIVSQMKKQLSQSNEHVGDRVSKIFLGALVQLIGGYRDAVEFRDTGKTFNHDKFIESRPAHLRPFLTKMMDLQIFQQFIDERLDMLTTGLGISDEFELETVRYAEKMRKRGRNYAFLKNVKEKTNPAVKSAVKSVKEGSRGVKTVYKDLKSKFRDITPPSGTNFHFNLGSNSPQHHLDRPDGSSSNRIIDLGRRRARGGHHSAPSSPVFSKRVGNSVGLAYCPPENINGSAQTFRRGPPPLAMSSSSSHIQPNGYAHIATTSGLHGNRLAASPTVSPASSLCSSEMNLSQELQNHPLFKSPVVDRSLKPSSSLDLNARSRTLTNGSNSQQPPARPPPPIGPIGGSNQAAASATISPASYYNHPYITKHNKLHPHVESKPPIARRGSNCPLALPPKSKSINNPTQPKKQLTTTDSSFDNPPEMESPPIPPRRQCSANAVAATAAAVSAGINRLERNCWQDCAAAINHNGSLSLRSSSSSNNSSSSSCSTASFVTAASTFSHLNSSSPLGTESPPMPAPRSKKESVRSLQPQHMITSTTSSTNRNQNNVNENAVAPPSPEDTMNDLISLDDSNNTSFDLEDFDPLNQNARPLPPLHKAFNNKKSTTLPAGSCLLPPFQYNLNPLPQMTSSTILSSNNSTSNPMHRYFTPQHISNGINNTNRMNVKPPPLPKTMPPSMPPPDDDFELLRKYGLDQFTLTATPNAGAPVPTAKIPTAVTTSNVTGKGMSNWTTFD